MEAVNLDAMLARFAEHWSPKKIARINDYDVRIVKVQGEFTWHRHADTDEFSWFSTDNSPSRCEIMMSCWDRVSFSSCLAASSTARAPTPRPRYSCSNQAAWSTLAMPAEN